MRNKPTDDKEELAKIYVGSYCYKDNPDKEFYTCQVLIEGEIKDYGDDLINRDYEKVGVKIGNIMLSRGIFDHEITVGKKLKVKNGEIIQVPIGTISRQQVSNLERGINEVLASD